MNEIKVFESLDEYKEIVPLNSIFCKIVNKRSICFTQTKTSIFAFENKCPHYSVPLETGNINFKGEVVCSLHAYRFNLENGWETTGKKLCLKRYKLDTKAEGIFIELP